jgi:hypothetical protein
MVKPILNVGHVTSDGAMVTRITNKNVEFVDSSGRTVVLTHAEVEETIRK